MHRCLTVPVPTFRLRDSLSECYITGRCLPAMTPGVLVMGDEVRTEENFSRRTITINSFTGRRLSTRLAPSATFNSHSGISAFQLSGMGYRMRTILLGRIMHEAQSGSGVGSESG